MQPMQQMKYEVRFLTPAFLGNAEQSGQWRTPPFKALLRQWWRVAYAAKKEFRVDVRQMQRDEGLLFGNAWLSHEENGRTVKDFCKSLVRMRLNRWTVGELRRWDGLEQETVFHPEVQRTKCQVGPHAYLGFGPLDGRGGTRLGKQNAAAIKYGETATLAIAVPDAYADDIRSAIALMNAYGAVGGRSRNGWGSLMLSALDEGPSRLEVDLTRFARCWSDALSVDWPHAIGRDDTGPLVWQTVRKCDDWKPLMRDLAILKIELRTMFPFIENKAGDKPIERKDDKGQVYQDGIKHGQPQDRHWLSYPTTNHPVVTSKKWPANARLPNSLRFKVRLDSEDPEKLRGVIFHIPCLPPPKFNPPRATIKGIWKRVHQFLDSSDGSNTIDLERVSG